MAFENPLNFSLTHDITEDRILVLQGSWSSTGADPKFKAYLVGVNPLTGNAIEKRLCEFSSGFNICKTGKLTYHGKYIIRVKMELEGREPEVCYEKKISLVCPEFRPHLYYNITRKDGFACINIECNCWKFSQNKVWLHFDGQRQPLLLEGRTQGRYTCYLATADTPGIEITDNSILKEERRKL